MDHFCIDRRVVVGFSCSHLPGFCYCRGCSFASSGGDMHARVGSHLLRSARTLWAWPPTRVVSRALGLSGTLCGSELTLGCLAHSGFVSHTLGLP